MLGNALVGVIRIGLGDDGTAKTAFGGGIIPVRRSESNDMTDELDVEHLASSLALSTSAFPPLGLPLAMIRSLLAESFW